MSLTKEGKEIFNFLKDEVVSNANKNGVDLQKEFGTQEKFKAFLLSQSIKLTMETMKIELKVAYELICGEGSYNELVASVYKSLTAA